MKKIKKSSALLMIAVMYILAFGAATVFSYFMRDAIGNIYWNLLAATSIATAIIFLFNLIFGNASVYDPYWSVQSIWMIAISYLFLGASFQLEHLIILIPLALWAIRLTANWAMGFEGFAWEDFRYRDIKSNHPRIAQLLVFVGIMLIPTLLVYAGTVPLIYVITTTGAVNLYALIVGGCVVLGGVFLETIADAQLKKCKKTAVKGTTCQVGLWRFSRHPNYLGEILIWIGLMLASMGLFWWPNLVGFLLIILLFVFISIPMMEKHVLLTRPSFAQYKKTTSMLLILPRRRSTDVPEIEETDNK